ncbi:Lrp/AsnC ligand binding domain-containing protein [Candidatus Chloroploca sp. M-50]|uniref:AsnC family transcriptional regulator n=2 Tax=Candidatus Chloroploca TaxID=1579476 RepID=A0A2H3KKN5_9CHLR|nr:MULTISPECIES: Lrp/AsnC ligand binding domain-containing protein [Candidatus Chloroploca]MBP1467709.1 Lrp/AsnC ligand binding domain-containing protein [Candidatus Chloroploca mongolica]NCC34757.1 Lrp/AsnC family transcriptional regulator [Chloroflexia bacterium]PDV98583.1 AsnC family transcriptional regulator [Candidatus Chloroploca asiatica]
MEAKAYVLIEAESGRVAEVLAALRAIPDMTAADGVTGPYDIIATVETADPRNIGHLVMSEIQGVEGIKRTVTCIVIG